MNSNKGPTDEDEPPNKRVKSKAPASDTQPLADNLFSLRNEMDAAIDVDDGSLFASLLERFEALGGWNRPFNNYFDIAKALFQKNQCQSCLSCIEALWYHAPKMFDDQIWFIFFLSASLEDIETIFMINPIAAYKELSILGPNPNILPTYWFGTSETLRKLKDDKAKVEWLKIRGIQIEWPEEEWDY
jgi:hypothetical protein